MLQRSESPHGQAEPRRQSCCRPAIDQEPGAVFQGAGREVIRIVFARQSADLDLANFAAPAASMNVIGNDPRPSRGMLVEPRTSFGVDLQSKVGRHMSRIIPRPLPL